MTLMAVQPPYTRKAHAIAPDATRTACGHRRRPTWPVLGSWRWLVTNYPGKACGACQRKTEET